MDKIKVIEKAKNLGLEIVDENELKGTDSKYRFNVRCIKCGRTFSVCYKDITERNRICRFCDSVKSKRFQTIEELYDKLKEACLLKDIEVPNINELKGKDTSQILNFKCSLCGNIRRLTIYDVLYGKIKKCASCYGNKNYSNEEKIEILYKKAEKCGYTILNKIEYTNRNDTKLILKCNKCGYEWETHARSLLSEKKCRKCSNANGHNFISEDIKLKMIKNRCEDTPYQFEGWYDENSKTTHSKLNIKCKKHDVVWHPTYKDFVQEKRGCKICANEINVYEERLMKALKKKYDFEIIQQYHNNEILHKQSFDFYFPKYKIAIEVQGEEHFVPVRHSKNDNDETIKKKHEALVKRDIKKHDIAIRNNITLLYFSYSKRRYLPINYIDTIYLNENDLFKKIDELIDNFK